MLRGPYTIYVLIGWWLRYTWLGRVLRDTTGWVSSMRVIEPVEGAPLRICVGPPVLTAPERVTQLAAVLREAEAKAGPKLNQKRQKRPGMCDRTKFTI